MRTRSSSGKTTRPSRHRFVNAVRIGTTDTSRDAAPNGVRRTRDDRGAYGVAMQAKNDRFRWILGPAALPSVTAKALTDLSGTVSAR